MKITTWTKKNLVSNIQVEVKWFYCAAAKSVDQEFAVSKEICQRKNLSFELGLVCMHRIDLSSCSDVGSLQFYSYTCFMSL